MPFYRIKLTERRLAYVHSMRGVGADTSKWALGILVPARWERVFRHMGRPAVAPA